MNPLNYIEARRNFYDTKTIELPGDEEYSQSALIRQINATRLSRYLDDSACDDIIGDFPYDNISKFRIRLEARATDFDTSHIVIEPLNGSREARIAAMIASKALQKHMRTMRFGNTLNRICDTLPEYGGVLVKRTKDGVHVVPWENVITDFSNIMGGIIIERHYMLPSELKKTNWQNVNDVIMSSAEARKDQNLSDDEGNDIETIAELIEVWELHGEVPLSVYNAAFAALNGTEYEPGEDDDVTFVSCQIIVAPQGADDKGEMQGVYLKVNEEGPLEDTYRYKARNPLPGRGLGQGIPEELAEHQRWHNFFKTEEVRAIAVGGKVVFVTDDDQVVDTIFDEGIEHGSILKVAKGNSMTQLNTLPTSIPLYRTMSEDWNTSGDKVTNSFAVALGSQEFSDTPFKAQYLQDINSNSQFKQYYEEISEELVQPIAEEWLLPDALKVAASDNELYETFSPAELELIDEVITEKALIEWGVAETRKKNIVTPEMNDMNRQAIRNQLVKAGSKRSVQDIKDFIKKDVLGKVIVHSSDERRNKQSLFQSYSAAYQMFAETDPARLAIRDRILDQMGVTKEELALYVEQVNQMMQQQPQQATGKVDAAAFTNDEKANAMA